MLRINHKILATKYETSLFPDNAICQGMVSLSQQTYKHVLQEAVQNMHLGFDNQEATLAQSWIANTDLSIRRECFEKDVKLIASTIASRMGLTYVYSVFFGPIQGQTLSVIKKTMQNQEGFQALHSKLYNDLMKYWDNKFKEKIEKTIATKIRESHIATET